MTACRKDIEKAPRDKGAHAGLLLSRYLKVPVPRKEDSRGGAQGDTQQPSHPTDRHELQLAAIDAIRESLPIYEQAYQRRLRDLK